MGIFSRIVDAVDNTVTDARGRRSALKETAQAATQFNPGDTIYVTNTYNTVTGPQKLTQAFTVGPGRRVGSSTLQGLILREGQVTGHRPAGVMTVEEYSDYEVAGPDAAKAVTDPQPNKRVKAGTRR